MLAILACFLYSMYMNVYAKTGNARWSRRFMPANEKQFWKHVHTRAHLYIHICQLIHIVTQYLLKTGLQFLLLTF